MSHELKKEIHPGYASKPYKQRAEGKCIMYLGSIMNYELRIKKLVSYQQGNFIACFSINL